MGPRVSVVIPNYNYARFIAGAIESVLAQSIPPMEVIVVDDSSTDDSREVVRRFGRNVKLIQQENSGVSTARNRGISESRGEIIALLDSDDVWEAGKLERQLPLFQNTEVGMVYSGYWECDANLGLRISRTPCYRGGVGKLFEQGPTNPFPAPSTALIRRTVLDAVGGFDVRLSNWADWDLWRRVSKVCDVDFVDAPLVSYRVHPSSMSRNVGRLEREVKIILEQILAAPPTERPGLSGDAICAWHLMLMGDYLNNGLFGDSVRVGWSAFKASPVRFVHHWANWPCRRLTQRRIH